MPRGAARRDHRQMDGGRFAVGRSGEPLVSGGRAFVSDAGLAVAVLDGARYPILTRLFGVPREQANLLTFVLALTAANATYDVVRRVIRHPWPLSGTDTGIATFLVRETGFGIAGPKAREVRFFGVLIAAAGIGGLSLPSIRRALHGVHVAEQRVAQQRRRIYGAAQLAADQGRQSSAPPRRHLDGQIDRLSDVRARSLSRLRSLRSAARPGSSETHRQDDRADRRAPSEREGVAAGR
jgi:hypothetical protein